MAKCWRHWELKNSKGRSELIGLRPFQLEFHGHQKEMKEFFVRCGRQFASLMGQHHVQYRSNAFYIEKGEYVEVLVDSRIMVDVAYFRKINPNYTRPHINELARPSSSSDTYVFFFSDIEAEEVKICSQTVCGWSFGNKRWRKPSSPEHYKMELVLMTWSGICGQRYHGDCLESIFFRQSRDSGHEKEGHHSPRQGSHIPRIRRCNRRLCAGKGSRIDNTSALRIPALDPLL